MAVSKIEEGQLFSKLNRVFRTHGYEGASLSIISGALGLGRASLYYRFPGGKAEMVEALLAYVEETCMKNMFAPLREPGPVKERVERMARVIDEFYEGGHCACLFETLSLGNQDNPFLSQVRRIFNAWVHALAAVAREAGYPDGEARRAAEKALVGIQGGLVFARASGDTGPFRRVLQELPDLLAGSGTTD